MRQTQKEFSSALVTFSGGQDSTTILAWAKNNFDYVEAISFNYGQKHSVELEQGDKICKLLDIKRTLIDITFLQDICDSALIKADGNVNVNHPRLNYLPASFVPNRNNLLLTLSNTYAQKAGLNHIVTGTCETDYSGYPDCRRLFIDSLENNLFTACNRSKLSLDEIRSIIINCFTFVVNRHDMPLLNLNFKNAFLEEFFWHLKASDIRESFKEFFGDIVETGNTGNIMIIGERNCSYVFNLVKDTELFKHKASINSGSATQIYNCAQFINYTKNNRHNVTPNKNNYFIKIHTPLMYLNKAQTFKLAEEEGALDLVVEHSHTCYNGDRSKKFDWGYGCGECPACKLRAQGFDEYKQFKKGD